MNMRGRRTTGFTIVELLIVVVVIAHIPVEQVAEVVSATCFISDNKEVNFHANLKITDDLKDICNQFKSGGTAKEGRGILDEYYTDHKIVDSIRNLIKNQFNNTLSYKI